MLRLSALCIDILRDKLSEGQHCSIVAVVSPLSALLAGGFFIEFVFFSQICVQRAYEALHHLRNAQGRQHKQQHAADS